LLFFLSVWWLMVFGSTFCVLMWLY